MEDWEERLPPIARRKLARIGKMTPEEQERIEDSERLDSLLSRFYGGSLDSTELWEGLKEYENQGKQSLLKEAAAKLKDSLRGKRLPVKFKERDDGQLTVEVAEEEERGPPLVLELTEGNFDEVITSYPLLVVDCWAPWCAPCRMVAPVIEELAKDYQGKITFAKLNVDDNQSVAMRFQIMSIPTLLIFKNGVLVDQKVGAMPRPMLEPELIKHI